MQRDNAHTNTFMISHEDHNKSLQFLLYKLQVLLSTTINLFFQYNESVSLF